MLSRAQAALLCDEYRSAIALLTDAIGLYQGIADIYSTRGIAYAKCKDYLSALADFQLASSLAGYKPSVKVLIQTARCRFRLGSHSAALLAIREALSIEPGDQDALTLKCRLLDLGSHIERYHGARSRKHWRAARTSYEACLTVFADESVDCPAEIQCWGIELLIAEGNWVVAMRTADELVHSKSHTIEVKILRALVLFLSGKLPPAFDQIVAVLKLDPDNTSARVLRARIKEVRRLKDEGNSHFQGQEWIEAVMKYSSALEMVTEKEEDCKGCLLRAILLLNRATARSKIKLYAEGLKDVNTALALDPSYFKAYCARGRIYVGLELYESAVEDFKSALEHGAALLNATDARTLKEELECAERDAERERKKDKDYYKILGLKRTCSATEIKKAYRTESLKHHPDKGGVAEKFKVVAEAYETLSDPAARRVYDAKWPQPDRHGYSSYYDDEDGYDDDDDDDDDGFYDQRYHRNGYQYD
ncbi:DnaJ-domain-containing protein [Sparassis latifolia]